MRLQAAARRLIAACLRRKSTLWHIRGLVLGPSGFEAPSHLGKCQPSSAEEGMPPEELQKYLWQRFFSNRSQWCDNRRSKPTPWHPDFERKNPKVALWLNNWYWPSWVESQLAMWDVYAKRPHESVSTTAIQAQGPFPAHEGRLEIGMCRALCEDGRIMDALEALNLLVQRGCCYVPRNLFYRVLKWCIVHKDLVLGTRLHALTIESGYEGDAFLATHLIGLYASHGRLEEAMQVFTKVSEPTAYNWAAIIFAYARHGEAAHGIRLYRQMLESAFKADNRIYVAVLKACANARDLVAGKEVHAHSLASPGGPDMFVQTGLLHMYAKCRSLEDARKVFDSLPEKNVVTWNAMLAGYAQQGMGFEAISLYSSMQKQGISPDSVTFVGLLQACASVGGGALHQGQQVHAQIAEQGLQHDLVLGGSLVNMYAKCGSTEDARRVFDRLPEKNVVTWTAMIAGYAQRGMGHEALSLHNSMQQECFSPPDSVTFVCLLQACASVGVGAFHQGKQLHAEIEERGLQDDVVIGGSLINMYAKCSTLQDARNMFDRLPNRNVAAWNTMLAGYVQQGMCQEALTLYSVMQREGSSPDSFTFISLLQACVSVGALSLAKRLHAQIKDRGLQADVVVCTSLIDMYAKCGGLEDARIMFDKLEDKTVVAWNALLAGHVQQGMGQEALNLYSSMQQEGIPPDSVSFVCILQACIIVADLTLGKEFHGQIEERGLHDNVVLGGSLVNMYVKCGSLEDARSLFDRLPDRNVVTWTVMIAGYAQHGMCREALCLYNSMQQEGITPPDSATFVCLLQACALVAVLPLGKQLHRQIEDREMQADPLVGAALVNMYAKCGSIFDAQLVFDALPDRTSEAWAALAGGYSHQGNSEVVFDLFHRMRLEGVQPDGITFLSVLTVCSHVGLVEKGRKFFEAMRSDYGISPTVEHYTCMIDLLGRAGHLDEALRMAKTMPFPGDGTVWLTLLGACRKWNNVDIGRQAFDCAVSIDIKNASSYMLMSNIYASAQMWEAAKDMQARRVKSEAWKQPGQSWWTDVSGVVHTFVVGGGLM